MFHPDHDTWLIGRNDPAVLRNQMHLVALQEARAASEYRASVREPSPSSGAVRRVAVAANASGSSVDLAACCA